MVGLLYQGIGISYWHNDNSNLTEAMTPKDAVNTFNDWWSLDPFGGFSDKLLLSIVKSDEFKSIAFGTEDCGCSITKVYEDEDGDE